MISSSEIERHLAGVSSQQPYPLIFATISGAHLYGFPSKDSDYDLRGVHVLPVREVVGLNDPRDTIESTACPEGLELDLVTHDIRKFVLLMLKKNGYVLEQLYSPLVVVTSPEHDELKGIGRGCITKHHSHHYLGFARTQWKLFQKHEPPRVKPLLYVYRVLLAGTHLMRTGEVQANLVRLNETNRLPYIDELIDAKVEGAEESTLSGSNVPFYEDEYARLTRELEQAHETSKLPERPRAKGALHDMVVRLRLNEEI